MGVGTKGLYRDLRLSLSPGGARAGMTLLPATTSFGTNFMSNTIIPQKSVEKKSDSSN